MLTTKEFIITITPQGFHTVRWKHNKAVIKTFRSTDSELRAKRYIRWIVKFYGKR